MATYRITAPDGRTFNITGDTAPTGDQLRAIFAAMPAAPRETTGGDRVRAALQGATFGFGDELRAGAGAALDDPDSLPWWIPQSIAQPIRTAAGLLGGDVDPERAQGYRAYRDAERQAMDEFREAAPIESTAWEVGGGALTGLLGSARAGTTTAGRRLADWAVRGGPGPRLPLPMGGTTGRLARSAAVGAGGGAAGGAAGGAGGAAELADVPMEMLRGAVIGGTLGAPLGAAGETIATGIGAIGRAVSPANFARRRLAGALRDSKISPDDARAQLAANPGHVIGDLGQGPTRELEALAQQSGTTGDLVENVLVARSKRAAGEVETAMGGPGRRQQILSEIAADRRANAPALYARAYEAQTPMTDRLRDLWQRPTVQQFWNSRGMRRTAQEIADVEGLPFDPRMFDSAEPSTMGWDYLVRHLDDQIGKTRISDPSRSRRLTDLRGQITDELAIANPELQRARSFWAGGARFQDAMEEGRKFMNASSDDVRAQVAQLSDADKIAYREGVRQAVTNKLERDGDLHDVTKHFNNEGMRRSLRAIFESDEHFDAFYNTIRRLNEQQRTMTQVRGGSPTARRLAVREDQANEMAEAVGDALIGTVTGGGAPNPNTWINLARRGARWANPMNRETGRDVLGELLLERSPERQTEILQGLLTPPQPVRINTPLLPAAIGSGVAGGLLAQ